MRVADYVGAAFIAVLGVGTVILSRDYPYDADYGPGAGFLPFWLGIALVILSGFLFWQARTQSTAEAETTDDDEPPENLILPADPNDRRLWLIFLLSTAGVILLFQYLGMVLTIGLFMLVTIRWVAGRSWRSTALFAVLTPAGFYLGFESFLSVPLPPGPLGF